MMPDLSHDEAFAALDGAALDVLDATERDAVLAHVAGCAECQAELNVRRATVANLAFAAPLAAGSAGGRETRARIRQRLMTRASEEGQARRLSNPPLVFPKSEKPPETPGAVNTHGVLSMASWRRSEWVALAAGILLVVSVGMLVAKYRDAGNLRAALDKQVAQAMGARRTSDSLATVLAARDSLIAGLGSRSLVVLRLTSSEAKTTPFARMFWDQGRNTWTLVAHNMPALKPQRTYQLWLVTPTAKISAGTFDPQNGDAVVRATYALSPDLLRALAVTEEPAGGAPQPTSAPIVAASLPR